MKLAPILVLLLPARPTFRWAVPSSRRIARRSRARSSILAGVVVLLAANLGLSIAVERTRPHWRDPEYFHRQTQLVQLQRWNQSCPEPRPLVVVLGSSRPQLGFSPAHTAQGYGDSAPFIFNLSQSGCQPLGQLMNLHRMLDAGIAPELLLIEVLPAALTEPNPLDDQIPLSRLGLTDVTRVMTYFDRPGEVGSRWLGLKLISWHALRIDLLAHAKLADWTPPNLRQDFLWSTMQPDGWCPYYLADWTAEQSEQLVARSSRDLRGRFDQFAINAKVAAAQRELLQLCQTRGIPVALFVMPESPAFRKLYSRESLELLRRHLDQLRTEFDIPLIDCRTWIEEESDFWDGNHLQGTGAERFSRRFGKQCLRSLLDR